MDPRLNPGLSPHRPNMSQDVRPPVAQAAPIPAPPQPPVASTVTQAPSYEVVGSIPMAQPGTAAIATPPAMAAAPASAQPQPAEDDFEKILQAVNNRVQAPVQSPSKNRGQILSKLTAKVPKVKTQAKNGRPIGAMAAVVAVVVVLSVVAVLAYKQGSKGSVLSDQASRVGTSSQAAASIQAAGGKLVSPGDLDDYSQDLGKKLNSLNDSQDFSADALSNAVLGL